MKKYFFAVSFIVVAMGTARAQDSCLADYDTIFASQYVSPHMPYTTLINTDSAFLDTCSGSATYREFYVKQWFDFAFQYGSMLQLPAAPADPSNHRDDRDRRLENHAI